MALLLACGVPGVIGLGCHEDAPPPQTQPAPTSPAASTRPEHVLESFDSSKDVECVHVARAADLKVSLATRIDPIDHFPLATVKVYNAANRDVIVGYEPGCVVLHCGDLRRAGPPVTFVQRREVLRPGQPLEFEFASGAWTPGDSTTGGGQELLTPTALPPGRYQVWATFRLGGADGPMLQSPRETYVVP